MYGNQSTRAQTAYAFAYAVMPILNTFAMQKVRLSIWSTLMEVGWAVFTFAQVRVKTSNQLYEFRFLSASLNQLDSCPYSMTWVKRNSQNLLAIFRMTAPLGIKLWDYLQAAIYSNSNNVHGLAGWRGLDVTNGVMIVSLGIAAFVFFLDTLHTIKSWYLTEEERELAVDRVRKASKAPQIKLTWQIPRSCRGEIVCYRRCLVGKQLQGNHGSALGNGSIQLYGESRGGNGYFDICHKAEHFSVADRNLIPPGTSLISAGCVVHWGFLSEYFQSIFACVLIQLVNGPDGTTTDIRTVTDGSLDNWSHF